MAVSYVNQGAWQGKVEQGAWQVLDAEGIDYGANEYHGLEPFCFSEAEYGISVADFGAGEYHGLMGLVYAVSGEAAVSGHPALRRLGLFPTGFEFDRSRQTRWA